MTQDDRDVVMWVQLPKAMTVAQLKEMGLGAAACYGGDTCIAATEMRPDVGLVVQRGPGELLRKAGLDVDARCFGGDTCIV